MPFDHSFMTNSAFITFIDINNIYILEINENETLVFSISFKRLLVHQNFVFIRQLNFTYSIKRSFFVLIDCQYVMSKKLLFKNKFSDYLQCSA